MEAQTIKEIERLAIGASTVSKHEINGRTLVTGNFKEITKEKYSPDTLTFTDLTSFAKIINEEKAKITAQKFIKIDNESTVKLLTELDAEMERMSPYSAHCDIPQFEIGRWMNYENFVIGVRAKFVQTDDRDKLISMIASIVHCDKQELNDNGISQEVRMSKGTTVKSEEVKSIIKLQPYRTFIECEQPESEFLFRITSNGTQFGLFEADGGRWKMDAKRNIKKFLETAIKNEDVAILI